MKQIGSTQTNGAAGLDVVRVNVVIAFRIDEQDHGCKWRNHVLPVSHAGEELATTRFG